MTDYKNILGIIAIVVGFAGYAPYLRDLSLRKIKPHAFSWLAWGILEAVGFFAQLSKGAGVGAYVTATSAAIAFLISIVAFTRRETEVNAFDWVAFGGSILGVILWVLTRNPLTAVILVTASDALAFAPTFRKSYYHPHQETIIEYIASVVKWMIALFALQNYNLTTWLYPASLMLSNGSFVVMTIIRIRSLNLYGKSGKENLV